MNRPVLLRKRFLPDEIKDLKDDNLIYRDESLIITSWVPIKPRTDFQSGISLYFLNKGYKISRILHSDNKNYHYYCDIVHTDYDKETDTYMFSDLLADVAVFPDGSYRVLDLDELSDIHGKNILSDELICEALRVLDSLLKDIYSGKFKEYVRLFEPYI